jgi:aspartate racemase
MKTIGLIGGMSWESSVLYYQLINRKVNAVLGGVHSGKSVMVTVDFEEIADLQRKSDWDTLAEMMIDAAKSLQNAGADMVLICANAMHKVSAEVASSIDIPLIHIGDVTAKAIKKQGLKKIGLLGTKYTMEQSFIKDRIQNQGIEVIIPEEADREIIHNVIYTELAKGIISDESRKAYLTIIDKLVANGAEGVILGCTEIGMLIKPADTAIPTFDTTVIHAEKAVELALQK